jgi:hypothetical protein
MTRLTRLYQDRFEDLPFISLDNISPNLLAKRSFTGNAVGYGARSAGRVEATKRDISTRTWNTKTCANGRRLTPETVADR